MNLDSSQLVVIALALEDRLNKLQKKKLVDKNMSIDYWNNEMEKCSDLYRIIAKQLVNNSSLKQQHDKFIGRSQ